MSERLEVLNPVADTMARAVGTVPRPKDLANKRLGLFWNSKIGGDVALLRVAELLGNRFPGVSCELIHSGKPGTKEQMAQAKRYDVVLGATGD